MVEKQNKISRRMCFTYVLCNETNGAELEEGMYVDTFIYLKDDEQIILKKVCIEAISEECIEIKVENTGILEVVPIENIIEWKVVHAETEEEYSGMSELEALGVVKRHMIGVSPSERIVEAFNIIQTATSSHIPMAVKSENICPKCNSYNEVWKKKAKTVTNDKVFCWHCGQSVLIVNGTPSD